MRATSLVSALLLAAALVARAGAAEARAETEERSPSESAFERARRILEAGFREDEFIRAANDGETRADPAQMEVWFAHAVQRGDLASAFRLSVLHLIAATADDTFPQRLLRTLSVVEFSERSTGVPIGEGWLRPLFDAAAALRPAEGASQVARSVEAAHLGLRRDFQGQRAILEALLREPTLLENLRPKILVALAGALEQLGEPALAANAYASVLEDPLPVVEQATTLWRAALLYLHCDRASAAERALEALAGIDPQARACALGAEQMEDVLDSTPAERRAYWERWSSWWPAWQAVANKAGLPAEGPETGAPVIANELGIRAALKPAIESYDGKALLQELRRVVSATRWLPRYLPQFGRWTYTVERLAPEVAGDYRAFLIAMLDATRDLLVASSRREVDLQLAIACADHGQPERSFALIDELRPQVGEDLGFAAQLARVEGVAALSAKTRLRAAASGLERVLAAEGEVRDRPDLVFILSDLYHTLQEFEAEQDMLQRELEHPAVKAARRDHDRLAFRLESARLRLSDAPSEPVLSPAGRTTPVDSPPRLVKRVDHPFAKTLRSRGLSGKAVVEMLVGARGEVVTVRVLFASHPALGDIASAMVARWQFEPAKRAGRNVAMRMTVPVYFPESEAAPQTVATRGLSP